MILTRSKHFMLGMHSVAALASCSNKQEIEFKESQYPSFYGIMEAPVGEADTRAYVDESFYGKWNKNDNLSIFYGNTYNKKYYYVGGSGTTSGRFDPVDDSDGLNGGVVIENQLNYAIYPYDDYNACQEADGTLIIPFPKERTISTMPDGIGASIVLVAKSETAQLPFRHAAGYLGFQLYGEGVTVSSITLKSNNNEPLSGSANVVFGDEDKIQVSFVDRDHEDDPTCTFNYSPAIALESTSEGAKTFWITLPPTVLANGVTLTVKGADGGVWERVSSLKEVKINAFQRFKPMEVVLEDDVDPNLVEYAKASTITGDGTYLIVNAADNLVFTGNIDGSSESVTPVDGIISDTDGTLSAYEFTVEQSGTNYYLKFNDGNYLVSDYSSPGNSTTGLRYVNSRSAVTYPYALTTANGAFMFSTTQMTSTSSTNQVLYYKTQDNANIFKIGGSGTSIGVHLYQKGGKLDRGLQFEPGEVVCLQGNTPERPELMGIFSTLKWTSDNTAVATVDGNGNVTVVGPGTTTITAEAEEDARYKAGTASYSLTILDASTAVYAKASTITVGGTYLIVDVADRLVFNGAQTNNGQSVSPENGVIIDRERNLSAYEFTVEKSGNNYYLRFSDGKYLICDYGNNGNSTSGVRYVSSQGGVNYPYALTVSNGAFFFKTSRADNGDANQYLYYKTADNANVFKIGGSGSSIGVHLYMKGGKQDRGLQFAPESVTCFLGSTPEKPELIGVYTTLNWSSKNTAVATVDGNGNVSVKGVGSTTITASAGEDDDYIAGAASYTLTVLDPNGSSYTKVSSLTVGGTYLIVDVDDVRLFKGAINGSYTSVSPQNGVITDTDRTLSAYEFTVEQSGSNYYLKFNDGKYLVSDYSNGGDSNAGLLYVDTQSAVTYPYALTVNSGAFMFSTTQMSSPSSTNQVLYYKPASAGGTGPDRFKIGGSGASIGVHLYLKGGGSSGGETPAKQTQTIGFSASTVTWTLGQNYVIGQSYALPQTATGAETEVNYTSETPSVATINNGRITIVAAGSATIKATATETDTFYGATATYTLNIATPAPEGWQDKGTHNLENELLVSYLNEAEVVYTNEMTGSIAAKYKNQYSSMSRQDVPNPVTISWTNTSSNTVVTVFSDEGLTASTSVPCLIEYANTSAKVYNLIPGRKYYYTITESGSTKEKGYFTTTGRRRMLKISDTRSRGNANNCRDLGGMITKDGSKRIKYGYLFRGSNMDKTTLDEKSILYNDLNIRMDVDLRSGNSFNSGGDQGNNNAYRPFTANDYSDMGYFKGDFSQYSDISRYPDRVKSTINAIFEAVLDKKGAAYFHCYVGADRTGFFGLLIEGLLGIAEKDCSIDYELTSFSIVGLRTRDGSEGENYDYFTSGLPFLQGQGTASDTFEQKCNDYLVSIGVSQERINSFKATVLENNN